MLLVFGPALFLYSMWYFYFRLLRYLQIQNYLICIIGYGGIEEIIWSGNTAPETRSALRRFREQAVSWKNQEIAFCLEHEVTNPYMIDTWVDPSAEAGLVSSFANDPIRYCAMRSKRGNPFSCCCSQIRMETKKVFYE